MNATDQAAVLGHYVANEMRSLATEAQQRLFKRRIMQCILALYDELDGAQYEVATESEF